MQTEKIKTYTILLLLITVVGGMYFFNRHTIPKADSSGRPDDLYVSQPFPTLHLPAKYFLNKDIVGREVDTTSPLFATASESNWPWTSASINSTDNYQTYPTTTISFTDYSNESKPLSSVDMSGYSIGAKKSFDVEGDGALETIETLCPSDSADGYCGDLQIVKGNTVIFRASSDYVGILPSPTGNGFYLKSENDALELSRADTLGYVKTRFVYDGKEFKPIYEQTVYYLSVQNSMSIDL